MISDIISYILQLLEMQKKKIAVLIGSLQTAVASLLVLLQLYGTLAIKFSQEQRKLHYLMGKPSRVSIYGSGKNQEGD